MTGRARRVQEPGRPLRLRAAAGRLVPASSRGAGIRSAAGLGGASGPGDASREKWGYGVWLFIGLVFGVPESWAGIATPPWPALSDTVGHLESLWSPVAVIVVALIVFAAFHALRYPPGHTGEFAARPGERGRGESPRGRTPGGRFTRFPGEVSLVPTFVYLPLAIGAVAAGSLIAALAGGDTWVLGYVIYGLFTVFLVIVPNMLAFWFARDVPFPTLFRTVADLERRWPPAAMIIVAGLVILMLHLVFFPWPDRLG